MQKEQLIVFVKAPRPGLVKTRLAQEIGVEAACQAYSRLVAQVLANIVDIDSVQLRFSPDDSEKEIQCWVRAGWECRPQLSGDLGQRLNRAFVEGFETGFERVAVIGSDCPDVTSEDIQEAWQALDNFDLALGPAFDGGYWLIALKRSAPFLFQDMPWSTATVFDETLKRAGREGMRVRVLRRLRDVDTGADWARVCNLIP